MAQQRATDSDSTFRHQLARWVLIISLVGLSLLAGLAIVAAAVGGQAQETIQYVFNALLPLFGTWVGTLLAFYFSKDNFQAASKVMSDFATRSMEQLRSTPVAQAMRKIADSYYFALDKTPAEIKLNDILQDEHLHDSERIPIIEVQDNEMRLRYIVHRSMIHKFITESALAGQPVADLTLQDLLDWDTENRFVTSMGFVRREATLADAKSVMDGIPGCKDIFVTNSGRRNESLMGWITNNAIARHAEV